MPVWLTQLFGGGGTAWREGRFPDTHPRNLVARTNALKRRRAKNKVAKRSRKVNR